MKRSHPDREMKAGKQGNKKIKVTVQSQPPKCYAFRRCKNASIFRLFYEILLGSEQLQMMF